MNKAWGFFILWSNFPGRYKKIQFQEPSLDPSATLHCALSDLKENERGVWPNMYRDGLATRVAFFFTTTPMDFLYWSLIWRIGIQIFGTGTVNYAFLRLAWPSTILQKRNIIILSEISHENVRKTLDGAIEILKNHEISHHFMRKFS